MTEKTHPNQEELFELLIGQLHGSRGKEVSAHVEECGDCFGYLKDFEKITTAYEKLPLDVPSPETLKAVFTLARSVRPRKGFPWVRSLVFSKAMSMAMISFVVAGIAVYFKDNFYQEKRISSPRVAETSPEKRKPVKEVEKSSGDTGEEPEGKDHDVIVMTADQDRPHPVPITEEEQNKTAPPLTVPETEKEKVAIREKEVPAEKTAIVETEVPVQTAVKQYEAEPSSAPAGGFKKESPPSLGRQAQQDSGTYKTAGLTQSTSEEENPDVLMTKAMTHEQRGEYAQAEEIYRTLEEKHPQFAKRDVAIKRRAKMLEKMGRREEARELRQKFKNSPRQRPGAKPGGADLPRERDFKKDVPRQSPDLKRSRPPGGGAPGSKPPGGPRRISPR